MNLTTNHAAVLEKRTIHTKYIRNTREVKTLLRPASNNSKLGGRIKKGKFKDFPMFSLTLEERKTCPTDCRHFRSCYGNGMPFAIRNEHKKGLTKRLEKELREIARKNPRGFLVRLHVLGDFFSVSYVEFWERMLEELPNLYVFGYTARHRGAIYNALSRVRKENSDRWWIRLSRPKNEKFDYDIFAPSAEDSDEGIVCPQQTGKTASCATCGFCWTSTNSVRFLTH